MMKKKFQESPVLQMPDPTKPFVLETDASKYASGAVLRQQDTNGDWHPCGYLSKSFNTTERNYEIYDRELWAIIRALTDWRHYLMGSPHIVTILSDHRNLTYFCTAQKLNRRQARWSLYLSEFNVKLIHVPGTKMIQSDALSRRPDHGLDAEHDNEDMVLLPDHLFLNLLDLDMQKRILTSKTMDSDIGKILLTLLDDGPNTLRNDLKDWRVETVDGNNVLYYKDRAYVPKDRTLRQDILRMFYDHETAGHPGELATYNSVRQHYWWPGLRTFVKHYVSGCGICQQFKIDRSPSHPAFQPIPGASCTRPFANCSMDLITDLPPIDNFDSILVVVDQGLSKGVILIPCAKTLTAEGAAQLLLDNLYKRFGLPDKMISDRGPQFAAHSFRELLKLLNITSSLTT